MTRKNRPKQPNDGLQLRCGKSIRAERKKLLEEHTIGVTMSKAATTPAIPKLKEVQHHAPMPPAMTRKL